MSWTLFLLAVGWLGDFSHFPSNHFNHIRNDPRKLSFQAAQCTDIFLIALASLWFPFTNCNFVFFFSEIRRNLSRWTPCENWKFSQWILCFVSKKKIKCFQWNSQTNIADFRTIQTNNDTHRVHNLQMSSYKIGVCLLQDLSGETMDNRMKIKIKYPKTEIRWRN